MIMNLAFIFQPNAEKIYKMHLVVFQMFCDEIIDV